MIKELCKFFAGFQLAHIWAHIAVQQGANFPVTNDLYFFKITLTSNINIAAIWINALIFLVLLYFAYLRKPKVKL